MDASWLIQTGVAYTAVCLNQVENLYEEEDTYRAPLLHIEYKCPASVTRSIVDCKHARSNDIPVGKQHRLDF